MHELEHAARDFLDKATTGTAPLDGQLLNECVEGIKNSILQTFHTVPESEFRLRMSNIGKDLRQLMLEKKYGREKASPEFLLKMLTGSILEHVFVYILKSAGMDIKINGEVTLAIAGENIKGAWDLKYGAMYDVKTASDYSYKNKFKDYASLSSDDPFGYVDQLIGYAKAEGCEPGGWIVMNKSTGDFKVVTFDAKLDDVYPAFEKRITNKIEKLKGDVMPPCVGLEAETFYKKNTGNTIIGSNCRFCPHKTKCHKKAVLEPSRVSKAREPSLVWYVD
jgi:hypothetical protein